MEGASLRFSGYLIAVVPAWDIGPAVFPPIFIYLKIMTIPQVKTVPPPVLGYSAIWLTIG